MPIIEFPDISAQQKATADAIASIREGLQGRRERKRVSEESAAARKAATEAGGVPTFEFDSKDGSFKLKIAPPKRLSTKESLSQQVVEALGRTGDARRAIKLAECARRKSMFSKIQGALIEHSGPWDERTLMDLALEHGMNEEQLSDCLRQVEVGAQIVKDRQHAVMLKVERTPVVSVNRKLSLPTDEDLRRAIRKVVMKESI